MKLSKKTYEGLNGKKVVAHYREGTSDERVLKEVIDGHTYRKKRLGFDVLPGERWLDLGANIGAFSLYCTLHGATADCYEPDPECFAILQKNAAHAGFKTTNAAVTLAKDKTVGFYTDNRPGEHYRGSLYKRRNFSTTEVNNFYAGKLAKRYDGIKMDIEGGEFALLDARALPLAKKLCMEYHTSVDQSVAAFHRRVGALREEYGNVQYPAEFDTAREEGRETIKPFFDRCVFAWRS